MQTRFADPPTHAAALPTDIESAHQIEVAFQFVTGTFDSTETYCDELSFIATRYLTTIRGFWFDCITSVPWSFMDLAVYRVRSTPALNCRSVRACCVPSAADKPRSS
jgi:hypothetical protein